MNEKINLSNSENVEINWSTASSQEIVRYCNDLINTISSKHPEITSVEIFERLAAVLPSSLESGLATRLLQESLNSPTEDTNQAILMLYARSIIATLSPFFLIDPDNKEDLFQDTIAFILNKLTQKAGKQSPLSNSIPTYSKFSVFEFYDQYLKYFPKDALHTSQAIYFVSACLYLEREGSDITKSRVLNLSLEAAQKMNVDAEKVYTVFLNIVQKAQLDEAADIAIPEIREYKAVDAALVRETISELLAKVQKEEKEVVAKYGDVFLLYFGILDGHKRTMEEVTKEQGITTTRLANVIVYMLKTLAGKSENRYSQAVTSGRHGLRDFYITEQAHEIIPPSSQTQDSE